MTKNILYSLHSGIDRNGSLELRITKFADGEVESSYLTTLTECECPAGARPSCRHRQMLPMMLASGIANTHWFWDFDSGRVVDFSGQLKSNLDALNELAAQTIVAEGVVSDSTLVGEALLVDIPPDHSAHSGDSIGRTTLSAPKNWRRL